MCQQVAQNRCDPQFQKLANFLRIAKISPIFKEAEVLPRRLPNFGNSNNFVFLTIKLSYFSNMSGYNYGEINNFGRPVQFGASYGGTIIFTRSIWRFSQLFQWKRGIRAVFLFKLLWLVSLIWFLATVRRDGFSKTVLFDHKCGGSPEGYSPKNWVGVCGPLPKTLTLFLTKICDIPYPMYELTLKSKPCFRAAL